MVQVIVSIDTSKIQSMSDKIPQVAKKGLELTGDNLIADLTKNSPVDHGLLKQWHRDDVGGDLEIHIKSPAEYARYVNDGTGIYNGGTPIVPSGKALKFKPGPKWNGPVSDDGYVYLKSSKGQKGQKFVEKSIESTKARITGFFQIAIQEVLNG